MSIDRQKVYEKYGGRCAYCGRKIEYKDMQVDHVTPKARGGSDEIENLMPSCRTCNHYKRANTLEGFRELINKIPSKLARDSYIYRVGMAYGFYDKEDKEVEFYFERCIKRKAGCDTTVKEKEEIKKKIKILEAWSEDDRIEPSMREEHKKEMEWLKDYLKHVVIAEESTEGCISREEAIDSASGSIMSYFGVSEFEARECMEDALKSLPSVKPVSCIATVKIDKEEMEEVAEKIATEMIEQCEDTISREQALSFPFANGKYDHENASEDFILGCETYKEWLEQLPSAQPKRKKGKWIVFEDWKGDESYKCSECRCEALEDGTEPYASKYCPNCGADMKESEGEK